MFKCIDQSKMFYFTLAVPPFCTFLIEEWSIWYAFQTSWKPSLAFVRVAQCLPVQYMQSLYQALWTTQLLKATEQAPSTWSHQSPSLLRKWPHRFDDFGSEIILMLFPRVSPIWWPPVIWQDYAFHREVEQVRTPSHPLDVVGMSLKQFSQWWIIHRILF